MVDPDRAAMTHNSPHKKVETVFPPRFNKAYGTRRADLDGDRPLAVILQAEYEPSSIEFLTADDESLQLGVMHRPQG